MRRSLKAEYQATGASAYDSLQGWENNVTGQPKKALGKDDFPLLHGVKLS